MVIRHGSYDADEVQRLLRCFLAPIELILFKAVPIELLFVGVVELSTILAFSLLPLCSTRRHKSSLIRMREGERIHNDTCCVG
jgi:hypothetical protein